MPQSRSEVMRRYRQNHQEKCREDARHRANYTYATRRQDGLCSMCGTNRADKASIKCGPCRDIYRQYHKAYREKLMDQIFEHYGRSCACCGEANQGFLTVDHANGGGSEDRRSLNINGSGHNWYAKLRMNGFPNDPPLQTMCFNCNFAKWRFGICPHKA